MSKFRSCVAEMKHDARDGLLPARFGFVRGCTFSGRRGISVSDLHEEIDNRGEPARRLMAPQTKGKSPSLSVGVVFDVF